MRGLGTIINALAIVIGGVLGILFKRFLKERYQDTIIKATGFSVVFLGAAGTLSKILTVRPDGTLSTGGSMVMILSLAWVLCRQFGPVGVWNAFWATEVLSAIVSLIVYKKSV